MKSLPYILITGLLLGMSAGLLAFQQSNEIIDMDGERFSPEDPREKAEWTFARYHYDLDFQFGSFRFQRWAADYPKSDRQFTVGVRRLTRLHARSTEHVIDAKSDKDSSYAPHFKP